MISGKNGSRQVIEAILAGLAPVSLSVSLAIVTAVANHASAQGRSVLLAIAEASLISMCYGYGRCASAGLIAAK